MNTRLSNLSLEDKIQLVEDLWDSISQEQVALTPRHRALLDRRLDQFEGDGDMGRPAAEGVAEIRTVL